MAYCSNCRETVKTDELKKIAIGKDRNVVFCAECNCYIAIEDKLPVKAEASKAPAPSADQPKQ